MTGRRVSLVINSHPHYDHVWGNQAFAPDVNILSTHRTRDLIATEGLEEIDSFRRLAPIRLEAACTQRAQIRDEIQQAQVDYMITYYEAIIAALSGLQIRLPTLTFEGTLRLQGTRRSAELISYDGAHSGSDAILYLPEDRVVFMGDLLFVDCHP